MVRSAVQFVMILGCLLTAPPAHAALPGPLAPLSFLLGDWEAGDNSGPLGQGAGRCAFTPGLQDRVIVRMNHADYPASASSPAVSHDDMMVIYAAEGGGVEAHYYDNEGHVIHYVVSVPAPNQAVFV
jgi:hypothetical protein